MTARSTRQPREAGQIVVLFALLLPMLLALAGAVLGIGNWYVHAKNLQTKADAGALAGGAAFEFPCIAGVDQIDQRIAATARTYAGPTALTPGGVNPQVGQVPSAKIHTVLNGPDYYDDDSNSSPSENLDICSGASPMRLNVKVTEDNSFPLASLIPLFPDIKKRATVELFQTDGMTGLLPIAVRAPEPLSALAIFYNEENGAILERRYLVKKTGPTLPPMPGLPPGLQGWSTANSLDPNAGGWASFSLPRHTGVVVAISYRGACNSWTTPWSGAPSGVQLATSGKCLEDGLGPTGTQSFATVNEICNQGGTVQVANCYYTTDPSASTPNDEIVQSGLHYIRGFTTPSGVGDNAPELGEAYMTPPGTCTPQGAYGSGFFAAFPNVCGAGISATFDVGTCRRTPSGGGWTGACLATGGTETRIPANVEVKYTLVTDTGNNDDICDFGNSCDVADSGGTNALVAAGPVTLSGNKTRYAVALRVRLKETRVPGKPGCDNNNFNGQCEWYFLGSGRVDTEPPNATIFRDPVTRAFRGDSVTAGTIRWLNLKADRSSCNSPPAEEGYALGREGSQPLGAINCFVVEMGLKGGIATNVNDPGFLFNDGIGASQMGYLDCTESGPQNIVWELMNGCPSLYGTHSFNYTPLCPPANSLFALPNPGSPWNVDWRPIRCVKTRPTSQGSDLVKGLNGRFFFPTDPNPPPQPPNTCPPQVGNGYVQGRNYWVYDGSTPYGYEDGAAHRTFFDPKDARKVTIFLTTPESFGGSGQNTYPITGAIGVYITGYGTIRGNGSVQVDDPCAGPVPSDFDTSGGSAGGRVLWGHFINETVLSAGATPTQIACNPGGSSQPCVPVLVE